MIRLVLSTLLIGYLPGALFFRLPAVGRAPREALAAEERAFWHVMLSLAWSLIVVFLLAASEQYRFDRLLLVNACACVSVGLLSAGRLRYRGRAARPSWSLLIPVLLIVLGLWRFFPPSEYIIGGKDPGTYMNEGIQIAQRGTLAIHDATVASVPTFARDLFFPSHYRTDYYGTRFMGFFLQDPASGEVIGQFPHLFPVSIAIGYGLDGLTGARLTVGVWGVLGLLAVYFAGARLIGRAAALAAAVLLSLNVVEVWFGRYPNSELLTQAVLFAALLAFARAQDDDPWFGAVAGLLAGLLLFVRIDALLGVVAICAASGLDWLINRRRPHAGFVVLLAITGAVGGWYLVGPMRAYFTLPAVYLGNLPIARAAVALAALALGSAVAMWLRRVPIERARDIVSWTVATTLVLAAAYAWFLRGRLRQFYETHPIFGKLAEYDASAFRDFMNFYLGWPVLIAALVGLILIARRRFWRDPALVLTIAAFSVFFFYKIRIVPEHFWAARRWVPVILPGALLFAAAAALGFLEGPFRGRRIVRPILGAVFLCLIGQRYLAAAAPVMRHVELAGIIPYVERLAAQFGDRDLVLVEARDAGSDTHVLALPLAYIYARNVLVLGSARPDKLQLRAFLEDASKRYARVFFVGGGGTDLLSRHIVAAPVSSEQIQVPEYESAREAYPTGVRHKEFDYGIYQVALGTTATAAFVLDVGYQDDLHVLRFNAKEKTEGRTIRWTGPTSYVAIPGFSGREREVVLVMNDGGRPKPSGPARVDVFLDDVPLGSTTVGPGFQVYRFAIPAEVATRAAAVDDPARLTLRSTLWNPHAALGLPDNRNLGVMVDRVEVH